MPGILHIDMDAFYASVEVKDDPSLKGKPLVVGGRSRRGVVCAASYEARKFGVFSAMPMMRALSLCPHATIVPPRMDRYSEISSAVFAIFGRYTPLVEGLSIDEAFLDVRASQSLFGDGASIARQIKDAIKRELDLPASAGVAPNKFIAKIASDFGKPDGLCVVEADNIAGFLSPLPVERMWGVGPKTAPKLHAMGLHTFADIARSEPHVLEALIGTWGLEIRALARGEDPRSVDPNREAKSVGAEETYEKDLFGQEAIEGTLLRHSARIAQRMLAAGLEARTVTVKLKYGDFSVISRRTTLPDPLSDTTSIYETAKSLLDRCDLTRGIRLTGVSLSSLVEKGHTLSLFTSPQRKKMEKLEEIVALAAAKFGDHAIERARLVESGRSTVQDLARRVTPDSAKPAPRKLR
ncbi:MAG: DNA polymerase IV [Polyangiaceae bacterium]